MTDSPARSVSTPITGKRRTSRWVRWGLPALFVMMLLSAFRPTMWIIEGPGMEPALPADTRVLVAPRWMRAARIGDVVVARSPMEDFTIIKRVVGVAGDRITWEPRGVVRNGVSLEFARGPSFERDDEGDISVLQCGHERLGAETFWALAEADLPFHEFAAMVVPRGHVYLAGDHRDRSNDSRYFGAVPVGNIVGVVVYVVGEPPMPCR